jgi:hypothetical protein
MKTALTLARVVCLSSALMAAHGVVGLAMALAPKAAVVKNNALTPEEITDGYELLWNGMDFTGWLLNNSKTNPGDPTAASNWAIVTTQGLQNPDKHKSADADSNMLEIASSGFSLFTADTTFRDFDLKAEWRGDTGVPILSGLLYHFSISTGTDYDASASQYQICNSHFVQEWKTRLTTAGCLYDMLPLLPERKQPDQSPNWLKAGGGEWNQIRIVSFGGRTAHYGNGLRLLEYRKETPEYDSAYRLSKFKSWTVHRTVHSGSFLLQDHGQGRTCFRNIRVKRLTKDPWAADSPYLDRDSAAAGDTALIDTLGWRQNLFPLTTALRPAAKPSLGNIGRGEARDALGRAGKPGETKPPRVFLLAPGK